MNVHRAALLIDRRIVVTGLTLAALSFAIALLMPRDLLVPPANPTGDGRPDLVDSTIGRFGAVGQGRDLRAQFVFNALPIVMDHPVAGVGPGRYGGAAADIFPTPVYAAYDTDRLFRALGRRIYTVRNAVVHAKEGSRKRYRPFEHDAELRRETPLMRVLAELVIIGSGTLRDT